jgi:hypothetical protein
LATGFRARQPGLEPCDPPHRNPALRLEGRAAVVLRQTAAAFIRRYRDHVAAVSRREPHGSERGGAAAVEGQPEPAKRSSTPSGSARSLAVPAPSPATIHKRFGAPLSAARCAAYHIPELKTGRPRSCRSRESNHRAYTDLLSDMRRLADPSRVRRPDGMANSAALGPRSLPRRSTTRSCSMMARAETGQAVVA